MVFVARSKIQPNDAYIQDAHANLLESSSRVDVVVRTDNGGGNGLEPANLELTHALLGLGIVTGGITVVT